MRTLAGTVTAITVVLALCACSRGGDNHQSNGPKLSDCDYANKVQAIIDTFQKNVGDAAGDMTQGKSSDDDRAQMKQAMDTLDTEMGKAILDLKALNVDDEMGKVNQELVGAFQDFQSKLPEARKAAGNGDYDAIERILVKGGDDFTNRLSDVDKRHPEAFKRLEQCG